jgi:hypothetical protein
MKTVNEQLRDDFIRLTVRGHRFEQGLIEQVDDMVVELHRELAKIVQTRQPATMAAAERVASASQLVIKRFYKRIADLVEDELFEFTDVEAIEVRNILTQRVREAMGG